MLPSLRLIPETYIEKGNNVLGNLVCTHTVFKLQFKFLRNCYYFTIFLCLWVSLACLMPMEARRDLLELELKTWVLGIEP